MNSRQRVYAALNRQPVDRVPVFMWFHPESAQRLAQELEIPAAAVSEALGDDIQQAWVGNNHAMEGIVHERDGESHVDDWGIEWVREGCFNQIRRYPLQTMERDEVLAYRYPAGRIEALLGNMGRLTKRAGALFTGCDISPCLFELVNRLRGMEETLIDFAADTELAEAMLEGACRFEVALATAACEQLKIDWLWTGDDVGGQQGMMLSPAMWRELIKPRLARIFEVARSRGIKVAYHSCGGILPIIPDLIEIGLDVLNPIQCNCPGMNPYELKREYGARLAFMGGLDTQGLLPTGTKEQVYAETRRLIEAMTAGGGGYILAASHTVPPETPIENILAMYAAAGITEQEIRDRAAVIRQRG